VRDALFVSIGAVVGANARYVLAPWIAARVGAALPYGTLAVNVSGSLLVGLVLGALAQRPEADDAWRLLLAVGFCGAYTTFSAFSYETLELVREGAIAQAGLYVAGSVALCLIATALGVVAGRMLPA
jgi:CrcB protein